MKLEILGKLEDYLKVKGIAEVNKALTKLGAKAKYRLLVNGFHRDVVLVRFEDAGLIVKKKGSSELIEFSSIASFCSRESALAVVKTHTTGIDYGI